MLVLLPNQLFHKKYIPKNIKSITLLEEPIYFGFREKKMNFNKLKLVLHRASMKNYYDYIKNYYKVTYVNYSKQPNYKRIFDGTITMFDPHDYCVYKKYKRYNKNITYLDNPNFLLSSANMDEYYKKVGGKNVRHSGFYNFFKNKLNVLTNEKSYDMTNRKPLPKNISIPKLPSIKDNSYVKEAKKYIQKLFPSNYGDVNDFIFPVNYKDSNKWLDNFIKKRFKCFGDYQDAIDDKNIFLFHSVITPMLNIGLLMPMDVLDKITKAYKKYNNIKINDYEGFVRQLSWREYNRFCHKFYFKDIQTANIFKHSKKLNKKWYNGTLGVEPIDFFTKKAFEYGYIHHIARLMVIGVFMNLCGIHPLEIYKWMFEFSCDSYEFVMPYNVEMVTWSTGGKYSAKLYISSDNYINKMGNFKKGEWNKIWRALFYNFINKNRKILKSTPYRNNINHYDKMTSKEKKEITKIATGFINKN